MNNKKVLYDINLTQFLLGLLMFLSLFFIKSNSSFLFQLILYSTEKILLLSAFILIITSFLLLNLLLINYLKSINLYNKNDKSIQIFNKFKKGILISIILLSLYTILTNDFFLILSLLVIVYIYVFSIILFKRLNKLKLKESLITKIFITLFIILIYVATLILSINLNFIEFELGIYLIYISLINIILFEYLIKKINKGPNN